MPVVQGTTGTVTIIFKEFGVKLNFKPTIAGDVIRLKVRPEVSALDFNNGITLEGFRVPALITRRAETDVELRDGQSFAIAGLLNNLAQNDGANIPFLSKIPIIGYLFKSNAERLERTELMVLVTPRLVRPLESRTRCRRCRRSRRGSCRRRTRLERSLARAASSHCDCGRKDFDDEHSTIDWRATSAGQSSCTSRSRCWR